MSVRILGHVRVTFSGRNKHLAASQGVKATRVRDREGERLKLWSSRCRFLGNWKKMVILRCNAEDNREYGNLHASLGALKGRAVLHRPTPSSTKLLFLYLVPIEGPHQGTHCGLLC